MTPLQRLASKDLADRPIHSASHDIALCVLVALVDALLDAGGAQRNTLLVGDGSNMSRGRALHAPVAVPAVGGGRKLGEGGGSGAQFREAIECVGPGGGGGEVGVGGARGVIAGGGSGWAVLRGGEGGGEEGEEGGKDDGVEGNHCNNY